MSQPEFQHYWRCVHHPSAIDNFFNTEVAREGGRRMCKHGCDMVPLKSTDSGLHPMPHGSRAWAELQRNGL